MRGETTFAAGTVPDYALTRASGDPLYTLVNPVDDALMKITHVLRGDDLLSSTPRQIALYQALIRIGVADRVPEFGHLPAVLGEGTKKLSKRDPQSNLFLHRDRGFIPEGLLNYLALLGWSIADDRDVFSLDEMVAAFDVVDVNSNPARFDQKKADALNAEHIRLLSEEDFTERLRVYFDAHAYDTGLDDKQFAEAARLVQTRIVVLADAWDLLKFLNDSEFALDEKAAAKELRADAAPVLDAAIAALEDVEEWTTAKIEIALKVALLENLALKPRKAFGPIRVAATGASISPPLFESLELLGRDRSLRRLRAGRDLRCRRCGGRGVRGALRSLVICTSARHDRRRELRTACRGQKWPVTSGYRQPMGYGVIGNTADSGSAILGSSPGTPALQRIRSALAPALCWPSGSSPVV